MRRLTTRAVLLLTAATVSGGCSDSPGPAGLDDPADPGRPEFSIQDGANGGNPHFFWLPPMVPSPSATGTFDGSRSPVVTICELDGATCAATQPNGFPLVFTLTSGPGGETVTVSSDHYKANWHTDEAPLDDTKFYRIETTVGTQSLGHADVDPVDRGKELKNVDTGEYIGLVNGRTLPVKFRIEEGAIDEEGPVTGNVSGNPNPAAVGEGITLTANVDDSGSGGSNVALAEYRVDGGAYMPMTAQDGSFDSATETVESTLAPFGSPGDRTVCVRGTDAAGNVGSEVCATLAIEGFAWAQVSAGANHTCGVSSAGKAYCWGQGGGSIGNGSTAAQNVPTLVSGGLVVAQIDAGNNRTCAVTTGGAGYCWGQNSHGEVGNGTVGTTELSPVAVSGGLTLQSIDQGSRVACGLTTSGAAYCWGQNSFGWIGDGTFTDRSTPTAVSGGLAFQGIEKGISVCATTTGGSAYCWGGNIRSELGIGVTGGSYNSPQAVVGGHVFTDLSSNGQTCGITTTGDVRCWGVNWTGALGFDPIDVAGTTGVPTPALAANVPTNLASITAGDFFNCGLDASGTAYCWGQNDVGQLGVDPSTTTQSCVEFTVTITTTCSSSAVAVSGGHTFVQIDAGGSHACGLKANGEIWCWGKGDLGQLGNGVYSPSGSTPNPTPVQVIDPA